VSARQRAAPGGAGGRKISSVSATTDAKAQIGSALESIAGEVPALAPLKLVFTLVLRGRGDTQQFRVELPDRKITKEVATDARVTVEMQRAFFNAMVSEGARVADWREAFHYGQAKATGVPQILKLIERVVEMQEERTRLRRAKQR
jgi:hypothetical protein